MKDIFLVDADDTILDFHTASARALRAAFEGCGIVWKEEYLAEFKKINKGLWSALERKELTRKELMDSRFHVVFAEMGLQAYNVAECNQRFLQHLSNHPIYVEGAEDFLRTLGKRGRVFIVTNGTAWIQKSRFDIAGVWAYVQDVFVSELVGHDKPAKEYTDYVISHIPQFDKARAVWIGDSLSADIRGANEAGITSIWFNAEGKTLVGENIPDYEVKNFEEALAIINEI